MPKKEGRIHTTIDESRKQDLRELEFRAGQILGRRVFTAELLRVGIEELKRMPIKKLAAQLKRPEEDN